MKKIDHKEVPYGYSHCLRADCPMAEHCLHQIAAQAVTNDIICFDILNPQLVEPSENCRFFRSDEPQVYARGFKNMQKQMLPGQYDTFRYRLIGKFGRNPYFERRKGARLCTPKDMLEVKAALKEQGLEHLEFDAYEERVNWSD